MFELVHSGDARKPGMLNTGDIRCIFPAYCTAYAGVIQTGIFKCEFSSWKTVKFLDCR